MVANEGRVKKREGRAESVIKKTIKRNTMKRKEKV